MALKKSDLIHRVISDARLMKNIEERKEKAWSIYFYDADSLVFMEGLSDNGFCCVGYWNHDHENNVFNVGIPSLALYFTLQLNNIAFRILAGGDAEYLAKKEDGTKFNFSIAYHMEDGPKRRAQKYLKGIEEENIRQEHQRRQDAEMAERATREREAAERARQIREREDEQRRKREAVETEARKKTEAEDAFWNSPEGMKVRAARMLADIEKEKSITAANIRIAEQERIAGIGRQVRQEERDSQNDLIRKIRDI